MEQTTAYTEFKNERAKHNNKVKKVKRDNKKYYGDSKFHNNTPFHDAFIQKRIVSMFTDMLVLKKYFAGSLLLADPSVNSTEHELITNATKLKEAYEKITPEEMGYKVLNAIIVSFMFHYVFAELQKVITIFRHICEEGIKNLSTNIVKSAPDFRRLRHFLFITCFEDKNTDEKFYFPSEKNDPNEVTEWNNSVKSLYNTYAENLSNALSGWTVDLEKFDY